MLWANLTFGKYRGKSLPQVVLYDPDYFFWGLEKGVFDKPVFAEQVYILEGRACNVKIPKPKPEDWRVRYHTDRNGRFVGFDIVEVTQCPRLDSYETWREDCLDLSVVRRLKSYDKMGGKLLLRAFKYHFFGGETIRLTKQRCEEFFSDESNFDLTPGKPSKRSGNPFADDNKPSTWAELLAESRKRQESEPRCDPLKRYDSGCSEAEVSVVPEWWTQEEEEYWKAEEKKSLERQAQYSWEAAERLREFLVKEEEEKALAAWAEEDRKRKEAITEADFFDRLFDAS